MQEAIFQNIPYPKARIICYLEEIQVAKQNYSFEKRQKEIAKKKKKEEKRQKKSNAAESSEQEVQPSQESDVNPETTDNI